MIQYDEPVDEELLASGCLREGNRQRPVCPAAALDDIAM
jgi:hypothetical protein